MELENFRPIQTFDELYDYLKSIAEEYSKAGLISIAIMDNLLWHWEEKFKVIVPLLKRLNYDRDFLVHGDDPFIQVKLTKKIEKMLRLEAIYQMGKIILSHGQEIKDTHLSSFIDRLLFYKIDPFYRPTIDQPIDTIKILQPLIEIDDSEKFMRYKVKEFFIHMVSPENEEEYKLLIDIVLHLLKSLKINDDSSAASQCKGLMHTLKEIIDPSKEG